MENKTRLFDDVSAEVSCSVNPYQSVDNSHEVIHPIHSKGFRLVGVPSVIAGLVGLAFVSCLFAVFVPIAMEQIQSWFVNRPTFAMLNLVFIPVFFPAATMATAVICVPLFWHVNVVVRFVVAFCSFAPTLLGFWISLELLEGVSSDGEFWSAVITVFTCGFVAASAVGLLAQLCTPWTLTHARKSESPLPRLGIRALMEITGIVAATIAFISRLKNADDIWIGCLIFTGIGGFAALTGIAACIGFLRDTKPSRLAILGTVMAAFAASFVFVAGMAVGEFGWGSVFQNLLMTLPLAAYGAVFILAIMAGCLLWLKACGWRCVR